MNIANPNKLFPVVGSRGLYDFLPPFNTLSVPGIEYTCSAVRKLSELLSYNENPKSEIYDKYLLGDIVYDEDLAEDAYIVSLQSAKGHWLYVPYRYIQNYPSGDAIQYRTMMLQFSLPSLPVSLDFADLLTKLEDTIRTSLGVNVISRATQTSQILLVKNELHDEREIARTLNAEGSGYAQEVTALQKEVTRLRTQNELLTEYIKLNQVKLTA